MTGRTPRGDVWDDEQERQGKFMTAKDVIAAIMGQNDFVLNTYVSDLTDAELLVRPVDGQNHVAWQLGHLIMSEAEFLDQVKPGSSPELPAGFKEAHGKEAAAKTDGSGFHTKDEYMKLYAAQRAATLAVFQSLDDAVYDSPGPERMRAFAPTMGAMFTLMANHPMMHAGQFVSVRRKLGKPVTI